ncbi:MAG: hypothetical protein ACE5IK_06570 [Acidobacteriota bacterium]
MSDLPIQTKRPYVRPRIGNSLLRSVWYLCAFAGLLLVAFILPRAPLPPGSLEGDWRLEPATPRSGRVPPVMTLLVHGGHYTLSYSTDSGDSHLEIGSVKEEAGRVNLVALRALTVNAAGAGSRSLPPARSFAVEFGDQGVRLTGADGRILQGTRQPFALTGVPSPGTRGSSGLQAIQRDE